MGYVRIYPSSTPWEFVLIPDSQSNYNTQLTTLSTWIANNWALASVKMVQHIGDWVSAASGPPDATFAIAQSHGADLLNAASVPWMATPGNHDFNGGGPYTHGTWAYYMGADKQTPAFNTRSYWGANDPYYTTANLFSYALFEGGGEQWILLNVAWQSIQAYYSDFLNAHDWLSGILTTYASRKAIIATHQFLQGDGTFRWALATSPLWQRLVVPHSNVVLVVNGNDTTLYGGGYEAHTSVDLGSGRYVHCVLMNYQEFGEASTGSCIGRFLFDGTSLRVRTFNTDTGLYTANDFSTPTVGAAPFTDE